MTGFTLQGARRVARATQLVEQTSGVQPAGPRRRRPVRGGGGGDPIVYGKLITTVPADSTLENAIELETYAGWFAPALDDDDEQILVHAGNPSLYSAYRGSSGVKVRVWGVMRTAEVSVDSELVDVPCFIIHGEFKDQMAAAEGHVTSPDNDKGQALIHYDGENSTKSDGGPCGGA